jgi:hypothetical protein
VLQVPKEVAGGGIKEREVFIDAPVETVWRVFSDVQAWSQVTDAIEYGRWTSENPWQVGSTFEVRIQWPHPVKLSHVVMSYRPYSEMRFLIHALGIVIERLIVMRPEHGRTLLTTQVAYIGTSIEPLPDEVGALVKQYDAKVFQDFKRACESASPDTSVA